MLDDCMSWGDCVLQDLEGYSRELMSKCAPQVAVFVRSG